MPSGPLAFLTFIDFRSPCTWSNEITCKGRGHLRGEEVGGGLPESFSVELEKNRSLKRLAFFSWSVSNRTIRANKRRKGRFTEIVGDVFGKRPERFFSRRI